VKALRITAAILVGFSLIVPTGLRAQDVQPKVYTPAPVGINVLSVGYAYSSGAVLFDKTIPIEDATGDIHSLNVAYSRSIGVLGLAGRADIILPIVTGDWEGEVQRQTQTTSHTGFADPGFRFAVFLVGAPALTREQFAGFKPKTIVGATLRMSLPLGQYDSSKLVNLGSNRWVFSPQVGVSYVAGRFLFEAYTGAWFFTDNSEFLGTNTLSQDPLFAFQVHVGYRFRPGFWLAASSRQSVGGATIIDGGDKLASEANNRIGLTVAYPLGRRSTIRLAMTTGLTAQAGNDYTTFVVGWQVVL
jgi:hypothetical protein